jgi:hypothetical protein
VKGAIEICAGATNSSAVARMQEEGKVKIKDFSARISNLKIKKDNYVAILNVGRMLIATLTK